MAEGLILAECIVSLTNFHVKLGIELTNLDWLTNQLRDEILQHIGFGDQFELKIILLPKIVAVVRQNSEAVMDAHYLEWLWWQ